MSSLLYCLEEFLDASLKKIDWGAKMPKWVAICPFCRKPFLYGKIAPSILELTRRDPFNIIRKPAIAAAGDLRKCPSCKTKVRVRSFDLTYSFL